MRSYDGESSSTEDDDRREGLPEAHLQQGSWQRSASHPTWAWEHRAAVNTVHHTYMTNIRFFKKFGIYKYLISYGYRSIHYHHNQRHRSNPCTRYQGRLTPVFPLLQLATRPSTLRAHLEEELPWVPSASAVSIFSNSPNRTPRRVPSPMKTDQTKRGIRYHFVTWIDLIQPCKYIY